MKQEDPHTSHLINGFDNAPTTPKRLTVSHKDSEKRMRDSEKFQRLKESKQKFIKRLHENPLDANASLEDKMKVLVQKAENLANFLLTKHNYKE